MEATANPLVIELDADLRVNWALEHNGVPVVREVRLLNRGAAELRDLRVEIAFDPPYAAPCALVAEALLPGASLSFPRPDVRLDGRRLRALVERDRATLSVVVRDAAGAELARLERAATILAPEEWNAAAAPELLASFVTPNRRGVARVLQEARELLKAATGDPTLDGYARRSRERVRAVADAVYRAVQRFDVTYAPPPASFEADGQKIRTPDEILDRRLASCLDLATLCAACFEQAGLNPLLVAFKGHALPGVWLVPENLPDATVADVGVLRRFAKAGEILCFEATVACARPPAPFRDALDAADDALAATVRTFEWAVDVRAARLAGVLPLPLGAGESTLGVAAPSGAAAAPDSPAPTPAAPAAAAGAAPAEPTGGTLKRPETRLDVWKEALLDLSLRNRLLNFRPETKLAINLVVDDLAALEDLASGGDDLVLEPKTAARAADARDADLAAARGADAQLVAERAKLLAAGRVPTRLPAEDLRRRGTLLFRAARSEIEETGGSTLFLALGMLRWFETDDAGAEPRLAPLLLLPAESDRPDGRGRVRVRLRDDEPRLNRTLCEKLRRLYGLDFPGLEPLPADENGVDVPKLLEAFRRAVAHRPRFELLTEAWLGFFSFSKFVLFNDLDAYGGRLLENPHVARLAGIPGAPPPEPADFLAPEALEAAGALRDARLVVDADSSQHAAVEAAVRGRSFVLQGPPGTGKSQTITNLIAAAVGAGKRVLFVAEKRAALDVVAKRLRRVGLGDACLELHSRKADKRAVVAELARTLEEAARPADPGEARLRDEAEAAAAPLRAFVSKLHAPTSLGLSAFDVVARATALRGAAPLAAAFDAPETTDAATFAARRAALDELVAAVADVGDPAAHPFADAGRAAWTPLGARAVEAALTSLRDAAKAFAAPAAAAATALGLPSAPPPAAADAALAALRVLTTPAPPAAAALLARPDAAACLTRCRALAALLRRRTEARAALAPRWTAAFFELDLAPIVDAYRKNVDALAPVRWFALRGPKATLARVAAGAVGEPEAVLRDLEGATALRALEREIDAESPFAAPLFGAAWRGKDTAEADVVVAADWAAAWIGAVEGLAAAGLAPRAGAPPATTPADAARAAAGLAAAATAFARTATGVADELALTSDAARRLRDGTAEAAALAAEAWLAALPRLRTWTVYAAAEARVREVGAGAAIDALRTHAVPPEKLRDAFEAAFLNAWLDRTLSADPALGGFSGRAQERAAERFRVADRARIDAGGTAVAARAAAARPRVDGAAAAASEVGLVLAEARKKRRHLPVRRLFERIPNLLPRLKPCLLMSPLSAAQFLAPDAEPFDLVVFDEASQIRPEDAVGAIARGRQTIVVGDSKQLPPTSFFEPGGGEDDGADDETPEEIRRDLESVLDEMVAARTPSLMLRWHYRSRDEALIAFSNRHSYADRLLTFPGPGGGDGDLGVSFRAIAGTFDRAKTRTNRAEAEAVAAEVVARLTDPARRGRSIGVVTFNQPQQLLIEDLLDRAREERPEIDVYFTDAAPEPVFVKNLENVQGDERDVMLFACTYGPDAEGRVPLNFGPLNRRGGERRLNVAVTRARERLIVFSALRPEQIDLGRTSALGVAHLKAFLRYAAEGTRALAETAPAETAAPPSGFERELRDALTARGRVVRAQVGCSGFRVDLAVEDPRAPGRFVLGILSDGAGYRDAATTRDRERLRESVLANLGWRTVRAWSLDWRADRDGELARLDAAIDAALAAPVRPAPPGANAAVVPPKIERAAAEKDEEPEAVETVGDVAIPAEARVSEPAAESGQAPAPASELKAAPVSAPRVDPPAPVAAATPGAIPVAADVPPAPAAAPPSVPAAPVDGPPSKDVYRTFEVRRLGKPEDLADERKRPEVVAVCGQVVDVESPVHRLTLFRAVADAYRVGPLGARVKAHLDDALDAAVAEGRVAVRGEFVWRAGEDPDAYDAVRAPDLRGEPRDVERVATEELAASVRRVLDASVALPFDDLVRAAAAPFGWRRATPKIVAAFEAAVALVVAKGRAVRDGDTVRAPK